MRLPPVMIGVIAVSCVVLAGSSSVFAQSFTFISSTQRTCWEDTEGFDSNLQPIPLPSPVPAGTHFVRRSHAEGTETTTFNVNGTFTTQDETSVIRTGGSGFGESHATCNGTFTFNPADSTLHTSSACTFTDTIPPGDTGTVTGIQGVSQVVMQGGGQAVLVHTGPQPPVVETVNVNVPGGGSFTYFRVCTRSGSAFFLQ